MKITKLLTIEGVLIVLILVVIFYAVFGAKSDFFNPSGRTEVGKSIEEMERKEKELIAKNKEVVAQNIESEKAHQNELFEVSELVHSTLEKAEKNDGESGLSFEDQVAFVKVLFKNRRFVVTEGSSFRIYVEDNSSEDEWGKYVRYVNEYVEFSGEKHLISKQDLQEYLGLITHEERDIVAEEMEKANAAVK